MIAKKCISLTVLISYSLFSFATNDTLHREVGLLDYQDLEITKELIKQKNEKALAEYQFLIEKTDSILLFEAFSVTHKTGVPPSGDKHDYMTIGPYWWPNPDSPDSLPYIRKDGEVNPGTRNNFTDYTELEAFFKSVKTLSNAFYYSDNKAYGGKALELIKAWFLDEVTKMNPNLNFGQSIPGINDGRPFGIIEFSGITEVLKCLELLADRNLLDTETDRGMNEWLKAYATWLQTSENGTLEANTSNNHGTHYDCQLLSIMMYLGDYDFVKNYLDTVTKSRIFSQIEPDGSQPLELARTKSFSYSAMNLRAFLELAHFGRKLGVDLWNAESPDGRSIKKACEFLIPYVTNERQWEHKQIAPIDKSKELLIRDLIGAAEVFGEDSFLEQLAPVNVKNAD